MRDNIRGADSSTRGATKVVVITLGAFKFSTRGKKAAIGLRQAGADVTFLGLSRAGRTGRWDVAGVSEVDGVTVKQVAMRTPRTEPTRKNQLLNVVQSYIPAFGRMAWDIYRSKYDSAVVVGSPLIPLGLLFKATGGQRLSLDVTERPGQVSARGSVFQLFSVLERPLLKLAAKKVDLASAVVPPDVEYLQSIGFNSVNLVRNAPLASWRAENLPIPSGPVRFCLVGSLFEGRGIEKLISAVCSVSSEYEFEVQLYGNGRKEYLDKLKATSAKLDTFGRIKWMGSVASSEVSGVYLESHVGLVLYDSNDPGNDGLSNKLMECVSSGRPVLAGDLPQNRRFVEANRVGWLCEMTEEGIAEGIRSIIEESDSLGELAARCREIGDSWLTWETEFGPVADQLLVGKLDPDNFSDRGVK